MRRTLDEFLSLPMMPADKLLAYAALKAGPGTHNAIPLGETVALTINEASHAARALATPNPDVPFFPRHPKLNDVVVVADDHPWLEIFRKPDAEPEPISALDAPKKRSAK